jgi:hypothetical protein
MRNGLSNLAPTWTLEVPSSVFWQRLRSSEIATSESRKVAVVVAVVAAADTVVEAAVVAEAVVEAAEADTVVEAAEADTVVEAAADTVVAAEAVDTVVEPVAAETVVAVEAAATGAVKAEAVEVVATAAAAAATAVAVATAVAEAEVRLTIAETTVGKISLRTTPFCPNRAKSLYGWIFESGSVRAETRGPSWALTYHAGALAAHTSLLNQVFRCRNGSTLIMS